MKNYEKLLIVMLVITVITSILAVSVCAEESHTIKGTWVFPKDTVISNNTGDFIQNVNYSHSTTSIPTSNTVFEVRGNMMYFDSSSYSKQDGSLTTKITLNFGTTPQYISEDMANFMLKWATPSTNAEIIIMVCDGSTCPATDANMDNVCDDCGMTFAVPRSYPDPDGWPSSVPSPPAQYDSFTILTENGVTWLYMVDGDVTSVRLSDLDTSGKQTLTFYINGTYPTSNIQRYRLIDGSWAYSSVNSLTSFSFDESLDFTYTTVDIVDAKGNVVFPLPLWAEIQTIAQGEVTQTSEAVHSVMMTLTLCGVGLIALLVVLSLFGKRSLISRN